MTKLKQPDKLVKYLMCKATVEQLPCCLEMPWNHSTVPMHGCLSAVSTQNLHGTNNIQLKATQNPHKQHIRFLRHNAYKGPVLSLSSHPFFTRPSTPMPVTDEFSSLAMNTTMTECPRNQPGIGHHLQYLSNYPINQC
jgi:hypothetical protein